MLADPYMAKALEYLLGVAFLLLFVGFWQYATGGSTTSTSVPRPAASPSEMFPVPPDVWLHPGHAWARLERPGVVVAGIDQFAQQLVGPIQRVYLPEPGRSVEQGEPALSLEVDSRLVDVVAPVSGRIAAVNEQVLRAPSLLNQDPYGRGWLVEIHGPRLAAASRQLLKGTAVKHFMIAAWEDVTAQLSPGLGTVMHDGGAPVQGLARAIDEANWDQLAGRLLLTERRPS